MRKLSLGLMVLFSVLIVGCSSSNDLNKLGANKYMLAQGKYYSRLMEKIGLEYEMLADNQGLISKEKFVTRFIWSNSNN